MSRGFHMVCALASAGSLLATTLLGLGGCWTYRAGERERLSRQPVIVQPQHWPVRTTATLESLARNTPREIRRFELAPGATLDQISPRMRPAIERPELTVTHTGIYGKCLVRIFGEMRYSSDERLDAELKREEEKWSGFLSNARALTSRTIGNERALLAQRLSLSLDDYFNNEYARTNVPFRLSSDDARYFVSAGLALRIPPPQEHRPRGILVHLTALVGNPYETKVMDHLASQGWLSFDIDTQTNVFPEVPAHDRERIAQLTQQRSELTVRYNALLGDTTDIITTSHSADIDPRIPAARRREAAQIRAQARTIDEEVNKLARGSFQFCPGDDPDAMARVLASELDNAIAGNAYAVEAVIQYIRRERRDLDGLPIVLIGFSAGGLATPASVARVRDDIEAAVIVGAGANLLMLSQESTLTDGGVRLRCGDRKLPRSAREDLYRRYLAYAKLDPYHTSQAMMGMPVLMLHGSWDGWVPAAGGDLLWKRLGKPDRFTLAGGHTLLFYLLPTQSQRIAAWLDQHVRKP